MNKKYALSIIIINITLIALIVFWFFASGSKREVVFVDNNKLFNGFKMTKELKAVGDKQLSEQNRRLDSIYKILNDPAATANKQELVKQAIVIKQGMEEYHNNFTVTNSEKIWNRINAYAKDFANENRYHIIVGSQNNDNILYGDEESDVTLKLLGFINSKYEGL